MPSGYRINGYDFDDLFDFYVEGPYSQDTGRRVGGVDLSRRYAHIQYGSKRPDVGHRVGGLDVSNLWAAKGTATYTLPFHGKAYAAHNQAKTNSTGSASASVTIEMLSDGSYAIRESISGGGNGYNNVIDTGRWLPNGASVDQFEVQFAATDVGQASFSTSAASFQPLSTSRSASASAGVPAASASSERGSPRIHVSLRRSGGSAQVSIFTASVSASGWY